MAGSVGPLGVRLEPLGKTGLDEARAAFAEQIAALAEAGVDMIIIETMPALNEAREALLAARETAPDLPVLVMVTVDDESNCLDGSSPQHAAAMLTEAGAGAIGVNCSTGPTTVLTAIEAMRAATTLPLAAMPNAGMPRAVEGRNIYLCSPEYMASFARKAIAAGAQIVGGCCGTTPNHIRAMRSAMRAIDAQAHVEVDGAAPEPEHRDPAHAPLGERSRIGALVAEGKFVTLVEDRSPQGHRLQQGDRGRAVAGPARRPRHQRARLAARLGAHERAEPLHPDSAAHRHRDRSALHLPRPQPALSIQSDLLGASSIGLHNILCLTGDPPKLGNYPDATAVFDVDAIGLVNIVRRLNHGLDIGANSIGASTNFTIGVAANPGVPDIENELRRFTYKVEAGAEYAITQPVFDLRLLEIFLERIEDATSHPGHRRHLAAHQPAQRRVHEERSARLHARRDHAAHGPGRHARCRAQRKASSSRRRCSTRCAPTSRACRSAPPSAATTLAAEVIASVLPQTCLPS